MIAAYDRDAPDLIAPYAAFASARLFAPVAAWLPAGPALVADIGAGTGRDAAWLAQQGHRVVAVEPAAALRRAGMALHGDVAIRWVDDSLPDLPVLTEAGDRFDLVLLIGVWHHLAADDRRIALARLRDLLRPGGRILLRVRSGPTATGRPGFDLPIAETIAAAASLGLTGVAELPVAALSPAKRAAGVRWTWLVLTA